VALDCAPVLLKPILDVEANGFLADFASLKISVEIGADHVFGLEFFFARSTPAHANLIGGNEIVNHEYTRVILNDSIDTLEQVFRH
jgi:hypothetical protein